MNTPQDRYNNDVVYSKIVDSFEALIHAAQLTPSEVRECALLAAIHYEMRTIRRTQYIDLPADVKQAFDVMQSWRTDPERHGE